MATEEYSGMTDETDEDSELITRVKEIDERPRRSPLLHWAGIILAWISLIVLVVWMLQPEDSVPPGWLWLDISIGVLSGLEFFTRSGFRWNPLDYVRSRFFDFIAITPALALIHYSVPLESLWVWIIVVARGVRAIDRLLGDGFVQRNLNALAGAAEEEITDRVLLRLMARIQTDMERGKFARALAESLSGNKKRILSRIRKEHPQDGLAVALARVTGLEAALERIEERVFDSIIDVMAAEEIENAVSEGIESTFSVMRKEIEVKSWRRKLGFKR